MQKCKAGVLLYPVVLVTKSLKGGEDYDKIQTQEENNLK